MIRRISLILDEFSRLKGKQIIYRVNTAGTHITAQCPSRTHEDSNPSCVVDLVSGNYHCLGCRAEGVVDMVDEAHIDFSWLTRTKDILDPSKCEDLIQALQEGIRKNADVAVVGMSGGADSTLVTALCRLALGRANVIGLHMPYGETDVSTFNERSVDLANHLGILNYTIPISRAVSCVQDAIYFNTEKDVHLGSLASGNTRSRMRMVTLYGVCNALSATAPAGVRHRVVGTGNLSEDYIGYDTKGGDALADFFPIGELFKQEVYDLLDHLASSGLIEDRHIDRVPSAGLWDGQTDEGELGHTYNEMAPAIQWLRMLQSEKMDEKSISTRIQEMVAFTIKTEGDTKFWQTVQFVWGRYLANRHKHMAPPVSWSRPGVTD